MQIGKWAKTFILLGLAFGLSSVAQAMPCEDAVTAELGRLGMGTASQPANFVSRTDRSGLALEMATQFFGGGLIVGISDIFRTQHLLVVLAPSAVFGGTEKKEIVLNESCHVESVRMVVDGTALEISPGLCLDIEAQKKGSRGDGELMAAMTKLAPRSYWSHSPFLIELVMNQCDLYRSRLAF